jgi:hypothetical protein
MFTALLGLLTSGVARADNIFVTSAGPNITYGGTVGEYTTSGATVNASLISGLNEPTGIGVSGSNLFVANYFYAAGTTVGEYTTSGATVNASLISGLSVPFGVAVSGSNLFVTTFGTSVSSGGVGEYTTSGATVNASLISGLEYPEGIAVSGSNLFVINLFGTVGEYTTSGATVNASLISGLNELTGIAVSGSDLFVVNSSGSGAGVVGEYTTSGATVNASLISGLTNARGIAVDGSDLFVVSCGASCNLNATPSASGTVGEYTTSGATVNASLISGLTIPLGIAVVPTASTVPEPSSLSLALVGLGLAGCGWYGRRKFLRG